MNELEQILRWLNAQLVPADDMTFVRGTLLLIEQQLPIPAGALARARALKARIQEDVGEDLFNVSISLSSVFKKLEDKNKRGQLTQADIAFINKVGASVQRGTVLEASDMQRLLNLAEM